MSLARYLPIMWALVGVATAIVWQIDLIPGIGAALPFSIIPIVWFFLAEPEDREFVTDYGGPTKLVGLVWCVATVGHYVAK